MLKFFEKYRLRYYYKKNRLQTGYLFPTIKNWTMAKEDDLYKNKIPFAYQAACDFPDRKAEAPVTAFSFWHGPLLDKCIFSIKSFIATQHYDYTLLVCFDDENDLKQAAAKDEMKKIMEKYPQVKLYLWDFDKEIIGTPFEKIKWFIKSKKVLPFVADDFRLIALYKWGGFYFDLDVMFKKDLSRFLQSDFCYCWEYQPFANNAILYMKKGSPIMKAIAEKCVRRKTTQPWIIFEYADKTLKDLTVYPAYVFDPLWFVTENPPMKEFPDFFKPFGDDLKPCCQSYKDFFPNAYAYHWHNCWSAPYVEDSYYGLFNKEFNKLLDL